MFRASPYIMGCRQQQWTLFWPPLSPADEP
jgi:hypothetical protein